MSTLSTECIAFKGMLANSSAFYLLGPLLIYVLFSVPLSNQVYAYQYYQATLSIKEVQISMRPKYKYRFHAILNFTRDNLPTASALQRSQNLATITQIVAILGYDRNQVSVTRSNRCRGRIRRQFGIRKVRRRIFQHDQVVCFTRGWVIVTVLGRY